MTLTATSLFAGGGGDAEGLRQAGYDIVVAANHWRTAVRTLRANYPDTDCRIANLSETDFRTFPRTDIAWISPSCVWHARSGGRKQPPVQVELRRADEGSVDRATAFAVIAASEVHRYEAVIVENVPEFMNWGGGVMYRWWLDGMTVQGYKHQIVILDSAEIGPNPVAQNRKRVYIVFTRHGEVDLAPGPVERTPATAILDPDPGELVTRRMYVTPQFEEITDIDVPHLVTYRRNAHARRADRHQLATVTAGGNHHAIATRTADGIRHRLLNNRERARAQGFPDDYVFHGRNVPVITNGKRRYIDEVRVQIGNAVSVNVARFLGQRVAQSLGATEALGVAA
ncbi:DNA cytosine methyltransferase [Nocardia vulneris]|uniref:DNA (cytosine-5-)-methyltransferase n=1 Tax=Nocardia vulneris TaxID=1141657 RepID=A0ABR4Z5D0_9NOCA|nr:DNA cytosine methyltransferase [Nocardia vulneris]KIA60550.1 site-specific DNA methylase [Nocardia vulneris]